MSLITRPFMNVSPEQAGVDYQRNTNCSDSEREAYEKGFEEAKQHFGFRTGDIVRACVPAGKRAGSYQGRVAVRASGSFNIQTAHGTVQGISHRHCRILQRADGYSYSFSLTSSTTSKPAALPPPPSRRAALALVSAPSL